MKIIIYEIVKLPVGKDNKKLRKYIYKSNYIVYFWSSLEKYKKNGISNYGGFVTMKKLKKMIGKTNLTLFKNNKQTVFHIFKKDEQPILHIFKSKSK